MDIRDIYTKTEKGSRPGRAIQKEEKHPVRGPAAPRAPMPYQRPIMVRPSLWY